MRLAFKLMPYAATVLALTGCGDTLDFRNAEVVNGKIFESGQNKPFSGDVTNVPDKVLLASQKGFKKFGAVLVFAQNRGHPDVGSVINTFGPLVVMGTDSLCDIKVSNGIADGDVVCKKPQSDSKVFQGAFNDGSLDGDLEYYGKNGGDRLISSVQFNKGLPDGKQEIYSENNGKLLSFVNWSDGVRTGDERVYSEETGEVIISLSYSDGKLDGDFLSYAADGKTLLRKVTYSTGLKVGVEEVYSEKTGKLLHKGSWANGNKNGLFEVWYENGQMRSKGTWANGKQNGLFEDWDENGQIRSKGTWADDNKNGLFEEWDANGQLVLNAKWENGKEVLDSDSAGPSANLDECLDEWIAAYHKENGSDSPVFAGQIDEWNGWCKEGKRP